MNVAAKYTIDSECGLSRRRDSFQVAYDTHLAQHQHIIMPDTSVIASVTTSCDADRIAT